MREESVDRCAAELAATQGGAIGALQLLDLGLSSSAIGRRVEVGRLHPVHFGVYAWGHRLLSPSGRLFAAVLACGDGAVASHRAAAAAHGILPHGRGPVDVTVSTRGGRPQRPGLRIHRRVLLPHERADVDGLPVTSVERTIADLAEVISIRMVEQAIATADRRLIVDMRKLRHYTESSRRGVRALRAALRVPPTFTRSGLERRFLSSCEQAGLPRPIVNAIVGGYDVDFHWPAERLIVETDGLEWHDGPTAFETDRRRDAELAALGWRVVRFTYDQVTHDAVYVVSILREILD